MGKKPSRSGWKNHPLPTVPKKTLKKNNEVRTRDARDTLKPRAQRLISSTTKPPGDGCLMWMFDLTELVSYSMEDEKADFII